MKHVFWLILVCFTPLSAHASVHDVYGLWMSEAKDGLIVVSDCGDGTPCGTLVWVDPKKADTLFDARNKDKAMRSRALIGVPIIWDFKRSNKGWKSGKIYNPEDGKTFTARIKRQENNLLQVKGCLGVICITNIWTREPHVMPNNQQLNERQ